MQAQELWNCLPPPPQCSCFYLEPNHSAATTNAHSSWCIHGAKAKPISLLWKLFHQYFYIYCCFFFQTAYQRHLLKRNICFLSFKDEETLVTQYRILHRKFWRTMKDNQMLLLKSIKAITLGVPFTDVSAMKCHWPNSSLLSSSIN